MSTASTTPTQIPAGTWVVDPAHSSVEFQVRNMGIVTVKGFFEEFEGSFESDGETVSVAGAAKTASVDTRQAQRDEHLRSADFFDGELTIKGITREVTFHATVQGTSPDPWGNERVGIEASTDIDRRDFDLNWDVKAPNGAPLASYDVKIVIHVGAVKGGG